MRTARRFASRPGEAIYNDANGSVEGNHFFQIVWLPEDRREDYLGRIRDLAREKGWHPSRPQIIFEGDAAAPLSCNQRLQALLANPDWPARPRSALAWLGEPIAIKEPTAACFRGQPEDHLLMVGQDGEMAAGVVTSVLLSLASQFTPAGPSAARFYVFDGAPDDFPWAGAMARVSGMLPHSVTLCGRRDSAPVLVEIARKSSAVRKSKLRAGLSFSSFCSTSGDSAC